MFKREFSVAVFILAVVLIALPALTVQARMMSPQVPPSQFRDVITHDKGNVVTTVANWGYIGGFSHLGEPSCEYPKNSGHHYLAEIKYWMGAITESGDTVVVYNQEDQNPVAKFIIVVFKYGITL